MTTYTINRSFVPAILIALAIFLAACSAPTHEFAGATLEDPQPVPDFTLTAANDTSVSLSEFQGQYVYLYFGYTYCPDACPTTLAKLARLQNQLGDESDRMQVIMVTVDPERDNAELLGNYVSNFNPDFIGLTGPIETIDAAGQPLGIYHQVSEGATAAGYLVDHTTRTYLIDPDGNARVAYPHDATVESMLADLQWLLANES